MNSTLLHFIRDYPEITDKNDFETRAKNAGLKISLLEKGGSRYVYKVDGEGLVLKVSYWSGGRLQNRNESHPTFRKHKNIFNVPIAWNKFNSIALYTEVVPYLPDQYDLVIGKVYGITAQEFCNLCYVLQDDPADKSDLILKDKLSDFGSKLIDVLFDIHNDKGSELYIKDLPLDYLKPSSYGLMKDGSVRIIDFGISEEYFNIKHEP